MKKTRLYLARPLAKAVEDLTREMDAGLKRAMTADGWEINDVAGAKLSHVPQKLSAKTDIEKWQAKYEDSDSAFSREYGTQHGSPQATVRRFMSTSKPWEKRAARLFERKAFK